MLSITMATAYMYAKKSNRYFHLFKVSHMQVVQNVKLH